MGDWFKEIKDKNKNIDRIWGDNPYLDISKGEKDLSKLIKKEITVTRGGKTFRQTVYVKPDETKIETPIGGELSPTVNGMNITKYSDKALLITGDTYVNIDTLRSIKKEINVGNWNNKLKGWIFPISFLETILGYIWSDLRDKGEDEKAQAVQNQKNSGLDKGDTANIQGVEGKIEENVSDSDGTKYNVKLEDGTKLNGVDEKVIDVPPSTDDKKIAETLNNATPESRVKAEKKVYGIKSIKNIQNYSLQEYMRMHGLTEEDIQKVVNSFTKPKKETPKKVSTGGSKGGGYTKKEQIEGLTKRQLIGKLIYQHYQAVKKAIESGEELKPEVLALYPELKEAYSKKHQAMSEETKRKISEALKKNKVLENENPQIKKENKEAEKEGFNQLINKEDYNPLNGKDFIIRNPKNMTEASVTISTKDYTNIPPLDIIIPKPKDILNKPKPYFIPEINNENFKRNGFTLSAVKVGEDQYLVALDSYEKGIGSYMTSVASVNQSGRFAVMSLDSFVATQNYYQIKAKEQYKKDQLEKWGKQKENLKIALKDQEAAGNQDMVNRIKRQIEYYETSKPKTKRLKILTKNRMTYDQMHMIEMFHQKDGVQPSRKETWAIYNDLLGNKEQKTSDLNLHQEYIDSTYTKGAKTSYGDSGTKDTLLNEFGVKVKRQNGDEITDLEINQIKNALTSVAEAFGNNTKMNKEFGLKISHSGGVLMHARKAVGLFHPAYNAIGVSAAHGDMGFKITFAHEYGHFIDYWLGKKTGNHYASDKQGSTANKIAETLRRNLNEKTSSAYYNRTCECLARSMEQYYAVEVLRDEGMFTDPTQVNKDVYENQLKPLIRQFLEENKEFLKAINNTLFG